MSLVVVALVAILVAFVAVILVVLVSPVLGAALVTVMAVAMVSIVTLKRGSSQYRRTCAQKLILNKSIILLGFQERRMLIKVDLLALTALHGVFPKYRAQVGIFTECPI